MNIKKAAELFDLSVDTLRYYERIGVIPPVNRNTSVEAATKGLFADLRALDEHDLDLILVNTTAETGLGQTYMNRLKKARWAKMVSRIKSWRVGITYSPYFMLYELLKQDFWYRKALYYLTFVIDSW